ncbi:hypothetical protein IAD21_04880 [Abditibacteriota bacterium]|nr:hypothetical protein IAD21_04880 [Abditibacteriota bacterium]
MTFLSSLRHIALLGALLLVSVGTRAQAATFTVSNLNDFGAGSLRQAVSAANTLADPDTIVFASGLRGTLNLVNGEIAISQRVTIIGPGSSVLTINAGDKSRIFNITSGAVALSGLALKRGRVTGSTGENASQNAGSGGAAQGGAIYNAGTLSLQDVTLSNNRAVGGNGGVGNRFVIDLNTGIFPAGQGGDGGSAEGGAIYNAGVLDLTKTSFLANNATGGNGGTGGDGINQPPTLKVNSKPAFGGHGGYALGGALCNRGTLHLLATTFSSNSVTGGTGGMGGTNLTTHVSLPASGAGPASVPDFFTEPPVATDMTFSGAQFQALSIQLQASGPNSPLTYSLLSPLPGGLVLNAATGKITGIPTVSGTLVTRYKVNDGLVDSNIATITFNLQSVTSLPAIDVNSPVVREGNGGTATTSQLVFTLTLSNASSQSVSVVVASGGTPTLSATAGSDYVPLAPTLISFAPGQTKQTVALTIVGDTVYEDTEYVALQLSSPVGATLAALAGMGTILDDDALPTLPSLSISDASVTEGNNGYSQATFTVSLSGNSDRTVSVGYSTYSNGRNAAIGGTETTPGVDYIALPPTLLTFAPGQTSKTITVQVRGDGAVEGDEIFLVRLLVTVNARLTKASGIGIIQNDDDASPADSPSTNSSDSSAGAS